MFTKKGQHITIIGAGLGGCFLALLLAKRGYAVTLYERLSKNDICDVAAKRSYNITVYGYAIEKLKEEKLWDNIEPYLLPLRGSQTQIGKDTKPIYSPTHESMQYYAVARARLIEILLKLAEKNQKITISYETSLLSINRQKKTILIKKERTGKTAEIPCDVIIGADGVNSAVRPFMQMGQQNNHTQEYAGWSYKQFIIPQKKAQLLDLNSDIAYTWIREGTVILAFPNLDGSLAAMLILPSDKNGFSSLTNPKEIEQFIKQNYPFLLPVLSDIISSLLENPEGYYVTIHTSPWYYKDFITVMGDAAHGFYPFFGQGTSAAFGDAIKLTTLIDTYGLDWGKIFPLYQKERKRHMDTLGELSKEGLKQYMRSKRADYNAIYDRIESLGYAFMPRFIAPPIHLQVMNDPDHTADYVENHTKQRRTANAVGLSLGVIVLTYAVGLYEMLKKLK